MVSIVILCEFSKGSPSRRTGLSGSGISAEIIWVVSICHWWAFTKLSFNAWHLALRAVLLSSVRTNLACISYMLCSRFTNRNSPGSRRGSAGVPGCEMLGLCGVGPEKESRCINVCFEALLLISRSPFRSPLLKLPPPCLNCQRADSGWPL